MMSGDYEGAFDLTSTPLILVVDDDPHIRQVVGFALQKAGYAISEAKDGLQALELAEKLHPAVIILDILMPEMDGTEVCRAIRKNSQVPIIFLSSKDDEVDRIIGLELGGDDYVTKPFSPRELVARVRAILRRAAHIAAQANQTEGDDRPEQTLRHGPLSLDADCFQVFWGELEVILTATEFGMLRTLMGRPGKVYSRNELMDGAYGCDVVVTDRTIDSHIRRIRKKLSMVGGDPVETVHGIGYRLRARHGKDS
jgi:two-component system, OmpR family, response regulator